MNIMKLIYTISYHPNVFINKCNNIISEKYNFFLLYIIFIIYLPLLIISLSIERFRYFKIKFYLKKQMKQTVSNTLKKKLFLPFFKQTLF